MYERIAELLVVATYIYLGVGILSALLIVPFGLSRIDTEAKTVGIGFRAIIVPGTVALWPLMLRRFFRATGEPPIQKDPHR